MADIKKICIFKCLLLSIMEFCFIFLWKEGNNSIKPTDYEIYIHVFEEAPSGACSNCTENCSNQEQGQISGTSCSNLQNSFHVDDLPKPVKNDDMAV